MRLDMQKMPAPSLPEHIVAYKNTKAKADIENELSFSFEYTDLLGRKQVLSPRYCWDGAILKKGGVESIDIDFMADKDQTPTWRISISLFVLNPAYISAKESVTFAFGAQISRNGVEWEPACVAEMPNFINASIEKKNISTTFFLDNINTRVPGTYKARFTAAYKDYFGNIEELRKEVTAIILSKDTPSRSASSSSIQSSSTQPGSISSPQSSSPASLPAPASSSTKPVDYDAINKNT